MTDPRLVIRHQTVAVLHQGYMALVGQPIAPAAKARIAKAGRLMDAVAAALTRRIPPAVVARIRQVATAIRGYKAIHRGPGLD